MTFWILSKLQATAYSYHIINILGEYKSNQMNSISHKSKKLFSFYLDNMSI